MSDPGRFFIDFEVLNTERFPALVRVFEALQEDKHKQLLAQTEEEQEQAFRSDEQWLSFFDEQSRAYFRWSTQEEDEAWLARWLATPVETRWANPRLRRQWSLLSLIETVKNGEYELLSCRMVSSEKARLEFNPFVWPFGGTACLKGLIEAFGFRVLGEKNGPEYIQYDLQ